MRKKVFAVPTLRGLGVAGVHAEHGRPHDLWPWMAFASTRSGSSPWPGRCGAGCDRVGGRRNFVFFARFSSGNDCSASANEPLPTVSDEERDDVGSVAAIAAQAEHVDARPWARVAGAVGRSQASRSDSRRPCRPGSPRHGDRCPARGGPGRGRRPSSIFRVVDAMLDAAVEIGGRAEVSRTRRVSEVRFSSRNRSCALEAVDVPGGRIVLKPVPVQVPATSGRRAGSGSGRAMPDVRPGSGSRSIRGARTGVRGEVRHQTRRFCGEWARDGSRALTHQVRS